MPFQNSTSPSSGFSGQQKKRQSLSPKKQADPSIPLKRAPDTGSKKKTGEITCVSLRQRWDSILSSPRIGRTIVDAFPELCFSTEWLQSVRRQKLAEFASSETKKKIVLEREELS